MGFVCTLLVEWLNISFKTDRRGKKKVSVDVCYMSAVQRAFLPWLGPPVGALILLQPGPLSCVRSLTTGRQRHIFWTGGSKVGGSVANPPPRLWPNWRRKLSVALRGEKERRGMWPTVFKLCLYVSADCECATAFHNGVHCLFGGESVGILFQSFLEVSCLTRWGLSTSCGWRQACCSLCPLPCLSAGICPLCPLCRPLNALIYCMFTPVEFWFFWRFFNDDAATFWIIFTVEQARWKEVWSYWHLFCWPGLKVVQCLVFVESLWSRPEKILLHRL